jgi:hypothetical protein
VCALIALCAWSVCALTLRDCGCAALLVAPLQFSFAVPSRSDISIATALINT